MRIISCLFVSVLLVPLLYCKDNQYITPSVEVIRGDVNGVLVENNGHRLIVYGDPALSLKEADMILFTHARRDLVWAGRLLVENHVKAYVPSQESYFFSQADSIWEDFRTSRFHDYQQRSTLIPVAPIEEFRTIKPGDVLHWQDKDFKVIATPGITPGAISYLSTIDGVKIAFTGDLIYGEGQILDLYSLQEGIEELNIRPYHGFASRISKLINSLETIRALDPDVIIPARGPVIRDPESAIQTLISRLRLLYGNYLSTSALTWYIGQEKSEILARRVLSPEQEPDWMPVADTAAADFPDWLIHPGNSCIILSKDSSGFLIDCGLERVYNKILAHHEKGRFSSIEGVFLTHYHDDHTDYVDEIRNKFNCPVYACDILEDILKNPAAYHLPCVIPDPMEDLTIVPDGYKMQWKEFTFTFYYFPGQTIYHDALLVEREDGERIFFIGDAFTPSGFDDYCLQNRNLIHNGRGYLHCLDVLEMIDGEYWMINQHVSQPFRFTKDQVSFLRNKYMERREILSELFPWDDPNYGIDARWARIHPYGMEQDPGSFFYTEVVIMNHSSASRVYNIEMHMPEGFTVRAAERQMEIPSGQEGRIGFTIDVKENVDSGLHMFTTSISFDQKVLHHWCEGMIEIL